MSYYMRVVPAQERRALIEEALKSPIDKMAFHHYQNKSMQLPVVRLPIEVPVYRMENYRTQVEQRARIRKANLPSSFFEKGQENESAQRMQHDILYSFAKIGSGDSIIPIRDVLEQEARQTEPLLVSSSGVVVNGNRRLAAMRELYTDGGVRFKIFSHVECLVLPSSATPREIKEVEVRLQMQPETRLPYGWVEEALAIRDLMESQHTKKQVAELLRKKESDIDQSLFALAEAELYLAEKLGMPEDYEQVRDSEQIFRDMSKSFKNKSGEDLEASRTIAQVLVENSRNLDTRVYSYNFAFGEKSATVLSKLAERLQVDLSQSIEPMSGQNEEDESELDIDLDVDDPNADEGITYKPLLRVLGDPTRKEEVFEALRDTCDSIRDESREKQRGQAALKLVQRANTELGEVDLSQADPRTLPIISSQLRSIVDRVTRLEEQLARMPSLVNDRDR